MDKVSSTPDDGQFIPPHNQSARFLPVEESLSPLSYRAQLTQKAAQRIPYTAEGLPVGYYRIDLLPNSPTSSKEELESLRNAYINLNFEHGYPTLPDNRPFWHKLDFEPGFAYGAFQIYLESLSSGPREIYELAENQELTQIASRSQGLPEGETIPKAQLGTMINEFSVLYYWRPRAKAHDLYKEAAYRHLRLRRQMSVEEEHYSYASKLMEKLKQEVFEAGDSFWAEISPKTAVDMLKALVAIQRISTGLPAAGPLSQKETPEDVTFEMIMRTLGQKTHQGNVYEHGGIAAQDSRALLDSVLGDKDAAANLQEVIIRVTRASQQQQQQVLPNPYQGSQARQFKGRNGASSGGNSEGNGNNNDGESRPDIITQEDLVPFDISGAPGENLDS